jgi:uncharacterized protein
MVATYSLEPDSFSKDGDVFAGDPAERRRDLLLVGKLAESGRLRRVWLDASGEQVVAVLGKRGTGKSYSLGVIVEGLSAGAGDSPIAHLETPRAALVLDIMDIFWTSQIPLTADGPPEVAKQFNLMRAGGYQAQQLNLDVWVPAGFDKPQIDPPGINLLRLRASDFELDDWAALFEVDVFGEPRGMLIADAVSHVSIQGYNTTGGGAVPPNRDYGFNELLACLDDDADIQANYRPDTIRSVKQRMGSYAALPLFQGDATPLAVLLQPFRSSVLMLGRTPDALKKVLVAVLLRRLVRERRDASFAQKRLDMDPDLTATARADLSAFVANSVPRTWVLMDEAHVLAGSDEPSVARDALVRYAKEGRNVGLSLALATQQPSALDSRLMSQVETLVVHQLTSPRDATTASDNMRSPLPTRIRVDGADSDVATLLRRLGQGNALFSSGNAPALVRLCVIQVRPRVTAHGGYEA